MKSGDTKPDDLIAVPTGFALVGAGAGALVGGLVFGDPFSGAAIGGGALGLIAFNGAVNEGTNHSIVRDSSSQLASFNAREHSRSITWRAYEPGTFALDPSVSQGLGDFQTGCLLGSVILVGGMFIAFAVVDGGLSAATATTIAPIGLDLLSGTWQTIDPSILPELFNALDKARAGGESALQGVSQVLTGFSYYDEILRGSLGGALGYWMLKNPLFEKLVETLFINSKLADALPGAKTYGQEYTLKVITSLQRYFGKEEKSESEVDTFADFVAGKVADFLKEKFPEQFLSNPVDLQNLLEDTEVLQALKTAKSGAIFKGELHIEKLQQQFEKKYSKSQPPSPIVQAGYCSSLADCCLGTGRKKSQ